MLLLLLLLLRLLVLQLLLAHGNHSVPHSSLPLGRAHRNELLARHADTGEYLERLGCHLRLLLLHLRAHLTRHTRTAAIHKRIHPGTAATGRHSCVRSGGQGRGV
jgi:hypothetical protein